MTTRCCNIQLMQSLPPFCIFPLKMHYAKQKLLYVCFYKSTATAVPFTDMKKLSHYGLCHQVASELKYWHRNKTYWIYILPGR